MELREAQAIAGRLLPNPNERLDVETGAIEAGAFAMADTNHDFGVDRAELVAALQAGRVREQSGRIVPARTVAMPPPPATPPEQSGLQSAPWFRRTDVPPGGGSQSQLPTRVNGRTDETGANIRNASLTADDVGALAGQSFSQVAGQVRTPEDVAYFINHGITYEDDRAENNTGPIGSWSSSEVLATGKGVCRDQHALARDLLRANGYEAELLGYNGTDIYHAVTAYKDPATGYWGVIEYGRIYPPSQVQAHSAEEALMVVRPTALAITRYSAGGPDQRSHVNGMMYTPLARVYQNFMAGPSPNAGTGVTLSSGGIDLTAASDDRRWIAGMRVVTDPRLPNLQGAVMVGAWHTFGDGGFRVGVGGGYAPNMTYQAVGSNETQANPMAFGFIAAEEFHPRLINWENIAGSGVDLRVGSHTQLQGALAVSQHGPEQTIGLDMNGASMGLSSLRWTPSVTVERGMNLWGGEQPDTRVHAGLGMGVDGRLMAEHYATGGRGFPVNSYATAGIETRPAPWVSVAAEGYMPITNFTNDVSAVPSARLQLTMPNVQVGTTQSVDFARYDTSLGVMVGGVQVGAFGAVNQDRRSNQTELRGGVQLTVANF